VPENFIISFEARPAAVRRIAKLCLDSRRDEKTASSQNHAQNHRRKTTPRLLRTGSRVFLPIRATCKLVSYMMYVETPIGTSDNLKRHAYLRHSQNIHSNFYTSNLALLDRL
jgi:hypothetical protein